MGSPDQSERTRHLRRSVFEALNRARERHDGRLSRLLLAVEIPASREGLTKDDFYRAAREETLEQLSASKLSRLLTVLESAGFVEGQPDTSSGLQRAIGALSHVTRAPERFRRALPRSMFCLRRSYLAPHQVNVSFVEMTADDLTLRYRETRAGSLGAASQRAVLEGTILHHDDLDDVYYVIGLTEYRTSFAVEEATSVHANLVVLSILRQCDPSSFAAFRGIHLGVLPENNPRHHAAPYAARLLMIETARTLAQAAQAGLIQNHPVASVDAHPGWTAAERRLLRRHSIEAVSNEPEPDYGLLIASSAGHGGKAGKPRDETGAGMANREITHAVGRRKAK